MLDIADNTFGPGDLIEVRCTEIINEVNEFKEKIQKRVHSLRECKTTMLSDIEKEWAKLNAEKALVETEKQ